MTVLQSWQAICFLLLCQFSGHSFALDPHVNTSNTSGTIQGLKPIDLSSAVKHAASISSHLFRETATPAIPIPPGATNIPAYEGIAKIAQAFPIVQKGIQPQNADDLLEDLLTRTNASVPQTGLAGRASALRVMIVGDSMTQGQQGDFTWRYRYVIYGSIVLSIS